MSEGVCEQLPDMPVSCSEFYEPEALMMEEEGMVIVGLLVGLNVLDANLCLKGEDLDSQVTWNLGFSGMNQISNCLLELSHLYILIGCNFL